MSEELCGEAAALIMIEAGDTVGESVVLDIMASRGMAMGDLDDLPGCGFSTDLVRGCAFPFV